MQGKSSSDIKMIDVSHYTGSIDWQKVANTGIKAAYMKASEGIGMQDETMPGNVQWATTFGIKCGAYHFAHPESNGWQQEADYFLNTVSGKNLELMPVLDYEYPATYNSSLSSKYMSEWAANWISYVKQKTGKTAMIYTGSWFISMYNLYGLSDIPLWISRYSSTPPADIAGWNTWTAWQYTDSEYVNGAGNCDMSNAVSLDALLAKQINQPAPQPTPTPTPAPTPVVPPSPAIPPNSPSPAPITNFNSFGALGTVTVVADNVDLCIGACTQCGVIRQIHKGEKYLWYDSRSGYGDLGDGWALMSQLSYTPGTATVVVDSLDIHVQAGVNSNIVGTAHKGDTFSVMDISGDWINVGDINGHQRWIFAYYLEIKP